MRVWKFLFICNSNRCRSVMAEYLLRHLARSQGLPVEAKSAGTAAPKRPRGTNPLTCVVLEEWGIDASGHQTQQVTPELVDWADFVLTVTSGHKAILQQRFPHAAGKIFTLAEFVRRRGRYSCPPEDSRFAFRQIRDQIHRYIQRLVERLTLTSLE